MSTRYLYYLQFHGRTFVIQAEDEAVEDRRTALAVLGGVRDLVAHGVRVVLVFGKGPRFDQELRDAFGARPHPETNHLVIPERALARIRDERRRIADWIASLCAVAGVAGEVVPPCAVRAERRVGHESTGVATGIDLQAVEAVLQRPAVAILGFGGEDERGEFLHVPSVPLAADLAVELEAQKLLLLTQCDGIVVPRRRGGEQTLSFADLEELLCLLPRTGPGGRPLLSGRLVPKVHAAIRAVAGGVRQVHIVSYARLLDEVLTRTGVGTMIERQQSHHVDYAGKEDLDEIERLHAESQRYTTPRGTPYVKPLDRAELERLLPQTLLLTHRGVVIGKLHATEVPAGPGALLIGGFVVGEDHQDSQHGQLLLSEALGRFRQRGHTAAAAITASPRAKAAFERLGGVPGAVADWQVSLFQDALTRYHPEERREVEMFVFTF